MSMGIIQSDGTLKKISGGSGGWEPKKVTSDPIENLTAGDLIYNTTENKYKYYNGTKWITINEINKSTFGVTCPNSTLNNIHKNNQTIIDSDVQYEGEESSSYHIIPMCYNNNAIEWLRDHKDDVITVEVLWNTITNLGVALESDFTKSPREYGVLTLDSDGWLNKWVPTHTTMIPGINEDAFTFLFDKYGDTNTGYIITNLSYVSDSNLNNQNNVLSAKETKKRFLLKPREYEKDEFDTGSDNQVVCNSELYLDSISNQTPTGFYNNVRNQLNLKNIAEFLYKNIGNIILVQFDMNGGLGLSDDDTTYHHGIPAINVPTMEIYSSKKKYIHNFLIPNGMLNACGDGYGFSTIGIQICYYVNSNKEIDINEDIDAFCCINTTGNNGGGYSEVENRYYGIGTIFGKYGNKSSINIWANGSVWSFRDNMSQSELTQNLNDIKNKVLYPNDYNIQWKFGFNNSISTLIPST